MSRRNIPAVADDFGTVLSFLKERGIVPGRPPVNMTAMAQRLHCATYSLILWRFRLKKIPAHGLVFIEEIASDALQILPQALMGYGKTAKVLLRGVIENAIRHIYFLDHPIEFDRMNRERKWYPGLDELFGYPRIHPLFIGLESKFDALGRLRTLYDDLSAGVHGRRVQDLEMRIALQKIKFDQSAFGPLVDAAQRCAGSVNFLLGVLHSDQVGSFQSEDRQIIFRSMPPKARQVWRDIICS